MPKKKDKKSGEKKDEDKKTSKKDRPATAADQTVSEDKDRTLYLVQIRHLNEQLERYQLKCGQLERQNKELSSKHSALEKEKKDIVEYLKHSLLEKEDEAAALTERLESQRQAADKDRDALQRQHDQLSQELQDRIEKLTAEKTTLAVRLAGLEEFQRQKEELMANMESLEKQLASQEEEHKSEIHNLEMKALLEKRRLEKEMESHVAAMAAEVQHRVDQKVPETTRLALQENLEVKARFSQLSEQAQAMMGENCALREHKGRLRVDVDILEQMLSETSRQSCIRKKVVEQLTAKCQQLQAELQDCRQGVDQLQTKRTDLLTEMEALRHGRASLSDQCEKNRVEVSRLEAELEEEKKRRSRMKTIMQNAAVILRQALMEAATEQDSEVDSGVQWKQLMQNLLAVLDRPSLARSAASENSKVTRLPTGDTAAARPGTMNKSASSLQIAPARHRPGSLGLAPNPTPKHKHTLSRMETGSSNTPVSLHRKLLSQKTTINSTDSAVRRVTSRNSLIKPK